MATMDEGEKSRFLETVRRVPGFREDLRREILTGGLFEVPERLERLAATVEDQGRQIDGVAGAVKVLSATMGDFAEQITTTMHELMTLVREGSTELRGQLADQGGQLADQGRQLADHGRQLADHGRQLADHGRQLAELRRQLADQGRETAGLRGEVARLVARFDQLAADVREIKRRLGF
jgi:ABC-type transporter Mla subunit MlaD